MQNVRFYRLLVCLVLIMMASIAANADVYGMIWQNVPASAANATIVPGGAPDATFFSPAINYNSSVTGYTFGQFLNSPTFLTGGGIAGNTINNSFMLFTGSLYLGPGINVVSITHDDGIQLTINGQSGLGNPFPTSGSTESWDVFGIPPGWLPFTLAYGECCGAPAVLTGTVNGYILGPIPEPGSFLLLGSGLFGLAGVLRRKISH